MTESLFEDFYLARSGECVDLIQKFEHDVEQCFFYKNVLSCFKEQFPTQHDVIERIEASLPTTEFQPWIDQIIKPYFETRGTTIEKTFNVVFERFQASKTKKQIPYVQGYQKYNDIIEMDVRCPKYFNKTYILLEGNAPRDYDLWEGIALMVNQMYYDTLGVSPLTTNFTGH